MHVRLELHHSDHMHSYQQGDGWPAPLPSDLNAQQSMPNGLPTPSQPSSPVRTSINGTASSSDHTTNATSLSPSTSTSDAQQPRLKIAYRPLSRPLNSYGGRNLLAIEKERAMTQARRTVRPLEEWGEIDMEGLTLSIRSRLNVELSYALSTVLVLSSFIGREGNGNSGLPLERCGDLVMVLVDLLEEVAFDGEEEEAVENVDAVAEETESSEASTWTHQELIKIAREDGSGLFAMDGDSQRHRPSKGPDYRSEETVLTILRIFRNCSMFPPNQELLAKAERVTDLIVRICALQGDPLSKSSTPPSSSEPRPLSPRLTLSALLKARDHACHYLGNVVDHLQFKTLLPQTPPRIFRLAASYLTSGTAALSPFQTSQQVARGTGREALLALPPAASDLAADFLSRFTHLDEHRKALSNVLSTEEVMTLFNALVRMLPVTREDFMVISAIQPTREPWVGYLERAMLCVYSLVFLAPPEIKRKMGKHGIAAIVTRLAKFYMRCVTPEGESFLPRYERGTQHPFMVISRRGMETLRLLDTPKDCFADDLSSSSGVGFPTFGIGYGEPDAMGFKVGDDGVGLLAGSWQSVVEDMLAVPGVEDDFFAEMESLVRLGNVYQRPVFVASVVA